MAGPPSASASLKQVEALWLAGPQKEKPLGAQTLNPSPGVRDAKVPSFNLVSVRHGGVGKGACWLQLAAPIPGRESDNARELLI
jgi:hypothetical protein